MTLSQIARFILESKKIMLKNALSELLWIYQAQTNVVSWLRERGNNIWNEWEVDSDGIYRIYESTTSYKLVIKE